MRCNYQLYMTCPDCMHPAIDCVCDEDEFDEDFDESEEAAEQVAAPDRSIEVSKDAALKIACSMYLGERCKYCGREYKTLDDLRETVWVGYHGHRQLACKGCWDR